MQAGCAVSSACFLDWVNQHSNRSRFITSLDTLCILHFVCILHTRIANHGSLAARCPRAAHPRAACRARQQGGRPHHRGQALQRVQRFRSRWPPARAVDLEAGLRRAGNCHWLRLAVEFRHHGSDEEHHEEGNEHQQHPVFPSRGQ